MFVFAVTPLAGVWIEIPQGNLATAPNSVTPLAGVWIEIEISNINKEITEVTPLAGVWIEIICKILSLSRGLRHSPCGSVD